MFVRKCRIMVNPKGPHMSKKEAKRTQRTADDWLLAAIAAMAEGGVENVKVERLVKQLGVSKGSFYWHFKDRGELLDRLIHYWVDRGTQEVMALTQAEAQEPQARLLGLFRMAVEEPVGTISSAQGEMAIRSWAMIDEGVAAIVAKTDQVRIDYVTALLRELGHEAAQAAVEAEALYLMLLGYYVRASYAPAAGESARQALLDYVHQLQREGST